MSYRFIKTESELSAYLTEIRSADWMALDTEFISEGKYQAELCLLQVAAPTGLVLIDVPEIGDITPFWERLCDPGTTVIAHSCRSEMEFCHRAVGRIPKKIFDIQLAFGFLGDDYPASFKKITEDILGIDLPKGETRTDWRARPLSPLQIDYALSDVLYLKEITERQTKKLQKLGRLDWFEEESAAYVARLLAAFDDDRWRRVPGSGGLSRQELAILRGLWLWRERKASAENKPPGRFLRDDLIIELAKRKTGNPDRIAALRGLARRHDLPALREELAAAISDALALSPDQWPLPPEQQSYPTYSVAAGLLLTVLKNIAGTNRLAVNLLASAQDVRDYIARREGTLSADHPVRLAEGWRRELVDPILDDVLSGRLALRLTDPSRHDPVELVDVGEKAERKTLKPFRGAKKEKTAKTEKNADRPIKEKREGKKS